MLSAHKADFFSCFPATVSKVFPSAKQTDFIHVLRSYVGYKHACRTQPGLWLWSPFPPLQQRAFFMQFQVTIMQLFVLKLLIQGSPGKFCPLMHPYANSFALKSQSDFFFFFFGRKHFHATFLTSFLQSWRREVLWRQASICSVQSAQSVLTVCALQGSRDGEQSSRRDGEKDGLISASWTKG